MMTRIQDQINDTIWAACDAFRADLPLQQGRDYIFVLLFIKYLSDWRHDVLSGYRAEFGDDEERIARRMSRSRFVLPQVEVHDASGQFVIDRFLADIYELNIRREQPNIGELVDLALAALETQNRIKLDRMFHHVSFNNETSLGPTSRRNARLKQFIATLAYLDMRSHPGAIGRLFLHLQERFAFEEGKHARTPHTPGQIARLLVALVQPRAGEQIADPVCGSGNLLIEATRQLNAQQFSLFGQEADAATWALARMNLYVHGFDGARLEQGDGLTNPRLLQDGNLLQFDAVLTHPPSPREQWQVVRAEQDPFGRFWRGAPPRTKAEYAYISHCLEITRPGHGRLALVAPHGVLFRGGAEKRIRQRLITDNVLDAVIALPANVFPHTQIPLVILLFDRSREEGGARAGERHVLMLDVNGTLNAIRPVSANTALANDDDTGEDETGLSVTTAPRKRTTLARDNTRTSNKNRSLLDPEVEQIVLEVQARRTQGLHTYLASLEEIAANDFDLNLPRYLYDRTQNQRYDLALALQEITQMEQELAQLRSQMQQQMADLDDEI